MTERSPPIEIGLIVFPNVQQLDLTGPYEVFALWPRARVRLIAKTLDPVVSSTRLVLTPDETYAGCPQLDVLCIPGGAGINALLADEETLAFVRRQAEGARFVTSVRTGALVLGAAGLLSGRRATTHWASHHILETLGAIPVHERVVSEGKLMTGGASPPASISRSRWWLNLRAARSPRPSSLISNTRPRRPSTAAIPGPRRRLSRKSCARGWRRS